VQIEYPSTNVRQPCLCHIFWCVVMAQIAEVQDQTNRWHKCQAAQKDSSRESANWQSQTRGLFGEPCFALPVSQQLPTHQTNGFKCAEGRHSVGDAKEGPSISESCFGSSWGSLEQCIDKPHVWHAVTFAAPLASFCCHCQACVRCVD
jgi:hypothetical protein